MQSVELTATSEAEARQKAAEQFGVDEDKVQVTVLEKSAGLFGQTKVRVQATLVEPADAESEPEVDLLPEAKEEEEKKPAKRASRKKAEPKKEEPEPEPEEAPKGEDDEEEGGEEREEVVASEEDAEKLVGMLNDILDKADLDATVKVSQLNGKYVNIELDGSDTSYLVGRRGEVLNSLQYLMNVISARQLNNGVRVVLDGNDYRKRRENVLREQAIEIADQVKERGEEAVFPALPAFERRVVHQALADYEGVQTYSEGEEPSRSVVISPVD
jgi:spoIIIJ-associated protein